MGGCAAWTTYKGEWQDGKKHGRGAEVNTKQCNFDRYEGQFQQGMRRQGSCAPYGPGNLEDSTCPFGCPPHEMPYGDQCPDDGFQDLTPAEKPPVSVDLSEK